MALVQLAIVARYGEAILSTNYLYFAAFVPHENILDDSMTFQVSLKWPNSLAIPALEKNISIIITQPEFTQ